MEILDVCSHMNFIKLLLSSSDQQNCVPVRAFLVTNIRNAQKRSDSYYYMAIHPRHSFVRTNTCSLHSIGLQHQRPNQAVVVCCGQLELMHFRANCFNWSSIVLRGWLDAIEGIKAGRLYTIFRGTATGYDRQCVRPEPFTHNPFNFIRTTRLQVMGLFRWIIIAIFYSFKLNTVNLIGFQQRNEQSLIVVRNVDGFSSTTIWRLKIAQTMRQRKDSH